MKIIRTPYLEDLQVKEFMVKESFCPVSVEEAEKFAHENPEEEKVVCPECFYPNGYVVAIFKGKLIEGGSTFYFKGTKFLVK